ncbi:uncharacterized protein LOC141599904 isoform X2 [Silene latifolia]|uniref:uncharacterized protein LOC141599904 isoform X2 n=1 Tax=Silene latifolia TaxID=37657 RepID=UPI003D774E74
MMSSENSRCSSEYPSTRSLATSQFSQLDYSSFPISLNLVSAARRHLRFLRDVSASDWLHHPLTLVEAIRRYEELWLPLLSDLTTDGHKEDSPMVLPPFDIEWVWYCHTLSPVHYRKYCEKRFSKVIGKALIFDEENEDYAVNICRDIWRKRYPNEAFENDVGDSEISTTIEKKDGDDLQEFLMGETMKFKELYEKFFVAPYMGEMVYLIAAKRRYMKMMQLLLQQSSEDFDGGGCSVFVPTVDILIMWITHQVSVYVKLWSQIDATIGDKTRAFLRLQMYRCHKQLKLDEPISKFLSDTWQRWCHFYSEFGTKGVKVELRHPSNSLCFKGTGLLDSVPLMWNDMLRAPSLAYVSEVDQKIRVFTSITPPVQAPYLLKCVPDRVTDDSGAMISDVMLRMNQYRPQDGRWLSRTVLDHARRECFVVRIRVGGGIWRRGGECPQMVKWEERIIEVREGPWSYVAGSTIGKAPDKVVGTAKPKNVPNDDTRTSWCFSTGDELTIECDSSASVASLCFTMKTHDSKSSVKLLKGRRMQYEVSKIEKRFDELDEENEFITIVRFSDENPNGKATALLNWRLLAVELLPEEDAVFVLLLSLAILRSVSELRNEDIGGLLIRRRLKEATLGMRDWGSVILDTGSSPMSVSAHLQPWYWNAKEVLEQDQSSEHTFNQTSLIFSLAEGGDKLYKKGILS